MRFLSLECVNDVFKINSEEITLHASTFLTFKSLKILLILQFKKFIS